MPEFGLAQAVRFLASVAENVTLDEIEPLTSVETLVEITHESIAELAYRIWVRHGRLEGKALQDWLQAQAQLRAERWASRESK